jgi:acetolactate synthase small subunit
MKTTYVLTIKAEDRPGLLHLVTGLINKKLIPIKSLSAAATDIHDIMLITVEVVADENDLMPLALKLENIIEVFAVEVSACDKALCLRAAYYKLDKALLESPQIMALQKHQAIIVKWYDDAFLVAKYGTDVSVRHLYNELEGPYLLGFSQSGLIAENKLITHDDIDRISRLAA